jgi:hypothetical protein
MARWSLAVRAHTAAVQARVREAIPQTTSAGLEVWRAKRGNRWRRLAPAAGAK